MLPQGADNMNMFPAHLLAQAVTLPMDNNRAENVINSVVIGHNNWLFAGSIINHITHVIFSANINLFI
ncbi:hypothetical protein D4F64_24175 [Salmonella enterica subsp. enterica]|nr:hypothetical protein [Salmonella enterica subsp. enterica]